MSKQKYFRGNLLKLKWGQKIWLHEAEETEFKDIRPEMASKEVVIQGSYGDLYGKPHSGGGYSVAFLDGSGTRSWVDEEQMEFIDNGGEHLFDTINENRHQRLLDRSIQVLEIIEDKSTDSGNMFVVKTDKPMIVNAIYKGRYDVESNYIYTYVVLSGKNNIYTIAPVVNRIQDCVKYFDETGYLPKEDKQ
jgi:hypothetical protein